MKYVNVTVLSLVLTMPGLAFGMGFNPFKHSSDHPGAPNNTLPTIQSTASVPEPATALSVGLGLLGLAAWRRYRQP